MMDPCRALEEIWAIVHIPTKKTNHKEAGDHYASDFDKIRKLIKPFVDAGFLNLPSPTQDQQ